MDKYTKGEWNIDSFARSNNIEYSRIVSRKCGKVICNIERYASSVPVPEDEYKANAKLIAAAPNLLEELSKVFEILDNVQELNMNNYNEDQVRELNDALIEAYLVIKNGNAIKKATEP